jgi:hypothetical protein
MTEIIDLLNDVAEFLEGQSDVDDGSYGEQVPNRAMSLLMAVEQEIERLKAAQPGPVQPPKRYLIFGVEGYYGNNEIEEMEHEDGEWVRWKDVASLFATSQIARDEDPIAALIKERDEWT